MRLTLGHRGGALALLLILLTARVAAADDQELRLAVQPSIGLLERHAHLNYGFGVDLVGSFGVLDYLDLEAALRCDRFSSLLEPAYEHEGEEGDRFYDVTRCSVVPGASLHFGTPLAAELALGVGYRFENQSGQNLVAPEENVLITALDGATQHEIVFVPRVTLEYRFVNDISAAAFASAYVVAVGADPELDLAFGIRASLYLVP